MSHKPRFADVRLMKGYWQVPLTDRAKDISEYTVIAFGMRNAPATFQRLVNIVLSGLSGCEAYLDDLVVYSDSLQSHVQQIRKVFERLCKANLTLNLARCELVKRP